MRVGLVAYNWEADTSLALWSLELYAKQDPRLGRELEIRQLCAPTPKSMGEEEQKLFEALLWIREGNFDVLGLSCYVWNIKFMNRLAKTVKAMWPAVKIIYGGQQVRGKYVTRLFEQERCADYCLEGEGEIGFQQLLLHLACGQPALEEIRGLTYRNAEGILQGSGTADVVSDINLLPSPYLGAVALPPGGAFLYEASRGCPYRCSFCIWGESDGVREYEMARVEAELGTILRHQPSHIMFCDGTFNMRKERAARILTILVEHLRDGRVKPFSLLLEQKLELIDDHLVTILDELVRLDPLVTLEFGLQSAGREAADLMRRPFSEERFRKAWNRLTPKLKSMAILDCIYGLPGDDASGFRRTVDFAFSLAPHRIQCFRLSVLPGSEFERRAEEYGLQYDQDPDHMVYATDWVDLEQMVDLQLFGFAVADLYHFHGVTIRCLLSLDGQKLGFSDLMLDFVTRMGKSEILSSLYGSNRPEGRWRAIDLSRPFADYLFKYALPALGHHAEELIDRFKEIMRYESLLGSVAVRGLEMERGPTLAEGDGKGEMLIANASIVETDYDIPGFFLDAMGCTAVDIRTLRRRRTFMALGLRAVHQGVKIPVSYRIGRDMAGLLKRFGRRRAPEHVMAEIPVWHGSGSCELAISKLCDAGLLVSA